MKKKLIFTGFVSLILLASSCDLGVTEWIEVTEFGSPYVINYDTGNYDPLMYGIDQAGQVHIKGVVQYTNTLQNSFNVFTLPEGYRPAARLYFPITIYTGTTWSEGRVYIDFELGIVYVYGNAGENVEIAYLGEIIFSPF